MHKEVIYQPRKGFSKLSILAMLLLAQKRPKLGIWLPNAGYDNQSCHILTVILIKLISYGYHSIISTVVLYSMQMYEFYTSTGVCVWVGFR